MNKGNLKLSDELEQLLKNLHLKRILEIYERTVAVAAEKEDVSYSEFLTRLLRAQWHHRQETALAWRIRQAKLPESWSLASFPFARQPGVNRKQIHTFAELDFIAKAENIVFVGETGSGQDGISVGLAAARRSRTATAASSSAPRTLFDEMYASLADRSSRKLLNRLVRLDVF